MPPPSPPPLPPLSSLPNPPPPPPPPTPLRSLIIFVVGAPGAGKTTQCAALASQHRFHHVQFDDFLRQSLAYAELKVNKQQKKVAGRRSSTFVPALSSAYLTTLTRHYQSKQTIPSAIRCRVLYSAMQFLSEREPLFRFLVDGYLESEDDWNEWAQLVKKRQAERDEKAGAATVSAIGFLPPIIIRLVCSESVGQLRWRRQLLSHTDTSQPQSPSSATPTAADIKARSMKYSLRTRPMIYRLGLVNQQRRQMGLREEKSDEKGDPDDASDEDDDPDQLAVISGMVIKRVDAEVPADVCYEDMELLVAQIIELTQDQDWTRLTGYETEEDDDAVATSPKPTAVPAVRPPVSTPVPAVSAPTGPTPIQPALPAPTPTPVPAPAAVSSTLTKPEADVEPDSGSSPLEVNWQEDPAEASERLEAEREELERLERTQRMLRLIEAEEAKWAEQQLKEEERERRKIEEEIRRIQEREELVEAESGHIRTRRDDRFVTFISTTVAVSMSQGVEEGKGQVWVEVYRGFERADKPGELRWLRVTTTAKLPVTSLNIAFPRVIVNTWRLSGNERERPVMFRLFHAPLPVPASGLQPMLIGESRTMLQHLLAPPEDKGLTLTLRKGSMPLPMAYLLVSPASLHTLLKAAKIIPPHKLHTVMADKVIIPAQIPLSPTALTNPPPATTPPKEPTEEKRADASDAASPRAQASAGKDRSHRKGDKGDGSDRKGRSRANSAGDRKEKDPKDEAEMEAILREMDEAIGLPSDRRPSTLAGSPGKPGSPGSPAVEAKKPHRMSLVEQARAALGRLSIAASSPRGTVKAKRESRHEKQRRELLEGRKAKRAENAKELKRRAASRERRRRELARIKKKAQVQKVSALTVDCSASHLPKQGLFTEGRFYLQVYRKRDKGKERERAVKLARQAAVNKGPLSSGGAAASTSIHTPTVKLPDEYPPGTRNWCIHSSQRHLVKQSLWSLVYSSPVTSGLNPNFAPFLLPLDDQPLLFVLCVAQGPHKHGVMNSPTPTQEGKDRVVGMVRLTVEDVVKMAIIQQREWDVDVYAMVEREKEKERSGQSDEWQEENADQRAAEEKHRVSVILKEPATIEKEREARRAKREAKKKRAGMQPVPVIGRAEGEESSDDDDSEDDGEAAPVVSGTQPMLNFFSLAFFTTRPVKKEEMGLTNDYTADVRQRPKSGQHAGYGGRRHTVVQGSEHHCRPSHGGAAQVRQAPVIQPL